MWTHKITKYEIDEQRNSYGTIIWFTQLRLHSPNGTKLQHIYIYTYKFTKLKNNSAQLDPQINH